MSRRLISVGDAESAAIHRISDDICIEADSGGHTDIGNALALWTRLRDFCQEHTTSEPSRPSIGFAGGIGTPAAVGTAFLLGGDFVLTGSINQCTVEAGMSDIAKDLLESADVRDFAYAPAGDSFVTGAQVQVLKRGTQFAARARHLRDLWLKYNSLSDIPETIITSLNANYFRRDPITAPDSLADPATQMSRASSLELATAFRRYFIASHESAQRGEPTEIDNFQIQCGPAIGAFNHWYANTKLRHWKHRHAATIADMLIGDARTWLLSRMAHPN